MADIYDSKRRSEIMSRVRGKDTKLERIVFSYLRKEGVYFQRNYANAPGRPDIALPRKKRAVFIDGDFWHGWKFEVIQEKLNDYWKAKIARNVARDIENDAALRAAGWQVLRVWEHDLVRKSVSEETLMHIKEFLVSG